MSNTSNASKNVKRFLLLFALGIAYGFMFGLGAALTPLFIILPLLGRFAQQLRVNQPWLERWLVIFGGSVLVVMGLYRISLMV